MALTTAITVVCPACAQEVTLPLRKVEVEADDRIRVVQAGLEIPTRMIVSAFADGPHSCGPRQP